MLFVLYLWHPKTQGALYLYGAFVKPFLLSHEGHIDEYVSEAKTWLQDFMAAHFQRYRLIQSIHKHLRAFVSKIQMLCSLSMLTMQFTEAFAKDDAEALHVKSEAEYIGMYLQADPAPAEQIPHYSRRTAKCAVCQGESLLLIHYLQRSFLLSLSA